MRRLRIRHLLVSFYVSVRCTICMEHRVGQLAANLLTTDLLTAKLLLANLLSADLLPKIHWLVGQSLILEPRVDLMTLLGRLWKDLLPKPSIISVHRHRPCR